MAKFNLIASLGHEGKKYDELFFKGSNRTNTGNAIFTSTTSGTTYSTEISYSGAYAGQGEDGMLNMLFEQVLEQYIIDETWVGALEGDIADAVEVTRKLNKTILPMVTNNRVMIDELFAYTGVESVVDATDSIFYDFPASTKQLTAGVVDLTKAFYPTNPQGLTNNWDLDSLAFDNGGVIDFKTGMELTVQDDVSKEVINVVDNQSTLVETVTDRTTPVEVVAQPYSTEGNGGRKVVRLDDGTLVSVMTTGTTAHHVYKSTDNGLTWTLVRSDNATVYGISIEVINGGIVLLRADFSGVSALGLDLDGGILFNSTVDSGQTNGSVSSTSVTIADNGDLHATWVSKNATYSNSFNIRYSKSINGGVTWDTPTQVTINNTSGQDNKNPSIVIKDDSYPIIIFEFSTSGPLFIIRTQYFNGSIWTEKNVFNGGAYSQSKPSADVLSDGTIVVAWHGTDAIDITRVNLRFSQSSDNGVTWSTMEKLTSGNVYDNFVKPSITVDSNDIITIVGYGKTATSQTIYQVLLIQGNIGAWGAIEQLTSNDENAILNPSACNNFRTFYKPLIVFQGDTSEANVQFYGKWTESVLTQQLETTAPINSYPNGANVYRSNIEAIGDEWKMGGFSSQTFIDKTIPEPIVSSAFTTNANAKPVVLDNGWIVAMVKDGNVRRLYAYKPEELNPSWIAIGYTTSNTFNAYDSEAMVARGNTVYLACNENANLYVYVIDVLTQTDILYPVPTNSALSTSSSTSWDGVSLIFDADDVLWIASSHKDSSYSNSNNVMINSSADFGVTWGTVTKPTTYNNGTQHVRQPSLLINGGFVFVFAIYVASSNYTPLYITNKSGSFVMYSASPVSPTVARVLAHPKSIVDDGGRMYVTWDDRVDASNYNVRCRYSDDLGVTWTDFGITNSIVSDLSTKLNAYPSITINSSGEIFIVWQLVNNNSNIQDIGYKKYSNGSWGSIVYLTDTNNYERYPAVCISKFDFDNPIIIWTSSTDSDVKFYGSWTVGTDSPTLNSDIRLNIESFENIDSIVAWLYSNNITGVTVDALLSIHADGANETFIDLADAEIEVDVSNNYYVSSGSVVTPQKLATLKYNLTRLLTTDDVRIKRIQGGVA